MKKIRALIIVAHPDDEIIWMGGTIILRPSWDWTILSLCRKSDPDRNPKFMKVCEKLQAQALMGDIEDEKLNALPLRLIMETIMDLIGSDNFDFVFTHGANGEYGHIRHKETHIAVKSLVKKDILKCRRLFFFSYVSSNTPAPHDPKISIPIADEEGVIVVRINEYTFHKKYDLIHQAYGFSDGIFETLSCGKIESFQVYQK